MALYIVGDIQGCFDELIALLNKVAFDPKKDTLWALGDIVARGPKSLETMRYLKNLGDAFNMVLGNHDIHLLAIYYCIKKPKTSDLLEPLLNAKDLPELITWLRSKPLLLQTPDKKGYLSHAGLSPQWSIADDTSSAEFIQQKLQSNEIIDWLTDMYGKSPNSWLNVTNDKDKFRFSINAFTRMRYCYLDGSLEFKSKQQIQETQKDIQPWFLFPLALKKEHWLFGHWASLLGKCPKHNIHALDTGCVWGNTLTMMRWEDKTLFTELSHTST